MCESFGVPEESPLLLNGPCGCGAPGWPGLGRAGLRRWLLGSAQQPSHCSVGPSPSPLARVVGTPRKMPLMHLVAWLRPLLLGPSSCWHLWGWDWQCWPRNSWSPGLNGQQAGWGWEQGSVWADMAPGLQPSAETHLPPRLLAAPTEAPGTPHPPCAVLGGALGAVGALPGG